mmetsp:Transcript_49061/g.59406  ORF Transcript_49061/g.59406 Transcript_49061/m.59406 type:complete len:227 (+) Transcript_49061:51-731(+)|eukprot:CAMPEP_0172510302 /NCGR_PEP_ID=MMETSP1066-20121228/227710_1 /TAXON_ID=671091 /ORGANISM="Coscinodiscus wailesii, Strain CCMP2513" /LENGTH=226 /DNA_ID=CAMNT_0013289205 /DNA_START=48 /DNA_END=728 /DNA_ORIENTATION=+
MAAQVQDDNDETGEMLVSEFPPPPYYYHKSASLTPPSIPTECLERAAKKAQQVAAAAAAAAEAERARIFGESGNGISEDNNDVGTAVPPVPAADDGIDADGEVVAVFGEIVEDPLLVKVEDDCRDPTKIRDTIFRLNKDVMEGFVRLVNELVHRPLDNKKCRDELNHNVFLMVQECNKYREHQAREILITILEEQLVDRQNATRALKEEIAKADEALKQVREFTSS